MFKKIKRIHFVGIGGSGMNGIAEVLLKLGYYVSGSDLHKNADAQRLERLGARVFEGHFAKNVEGADVVVTSTAISKKNPEVKTALKLGIPVIPRIEMLAEIARLKYTIAISGTHGKTTTTSLIGHLLKTCGLDPTVVVGGRLKAVGTGGVLGTGDFLVAEADESDGSFLKLSPTISVITNIDNDHLDYYKTEQRLLEAFTTFAQRIPFYGITYLCEEDPGVRKILPNLHRRYATYGFRKGCLLRADHVELIEAGATFEVILDGKSLGRINSPLAGKHNVLNALAAIAVALHIDIPFRDIAAAVSSFQGVGRRIEVKGEYKGAVVVDDYGHHPTEIKATLAAVRARWPGRRLNVIFQPHRYTRTQLLAKEFGASLGGADRIYLMDIYPAGEKPIKGVTSRLIAKAIKKKNWTAWSGEKSFGDLQASLGSSDVLLTLGAGDVWKLAERLAAVQREPGATGRSLADRIKAEIPSASGRAKSEEPLSRHCTWAIGGPAEAYIEVHNLSELQALQNFSRKNGIPLFVLGWGSNILLPDEGLRGCVVRLRGDFEKIEFKGDSVEVGAGVHLPKLARICAEKGLAGVEALAGVPGTVGGALMTNAGTPRGVIGDVVSRVHILKNDGTVETMPRDRIHLGYRSSSLVGQWVVGATLRLNPSQNGSVMERLKAELANRERTQPLGTKNVGSVFRNPSNDYAARLIEAVGLKGVQKGGVRFSPKHANFMENTGGATAREALALIRHAQRLVKERFHIDLEPEVVVIRPEEPGKPNP